MPEQHTDLSSTTQFAPKQASTYTYESLDEQEFRLLEILPTSSSSQSPLQCNIKVASLRDRENLQYEAVSYVWGDPTPNKTILMNGKCLHLSMNSDKALRRMALPDRNRTVYLDAVCINQTDIAERGQQVLLMGDIYRYTQSTLVYLGDADDSTEAAFENLKLLSEEAEDDIGFLKGVAELIGLDCGRHVYSKDPVKTEVDRESLARLFQSHWFQREWVVQEVALASDSVLICGPFEIDMELVLTVATWLYLYKGPHIGGGLVDDLASAANIFISRYRLGKIGGIPISDMLFWSHDLQATNGRDKVYGMLGLVDKAKLSGASIPDYTRPVPHVFRDAVKQSFFVTLLILRSASYRDEADLSENGGFPSWVPRFDRSWNKYQDPNIFRMHGGQAPLVDRFLIRSAMRDCQHQDIMVFAGLEMCRVAEVSNVLDVSSSEAAGITGQLEILVSWYGEITEMLQKRGLAENGLPRTLIANTDHGLKRSSTEYLKGLSSMLECHREERQLITTQEITESMNQTIRQASGFRRAMQNACQQRRFAILSNGSIGIVAKLTRTDDLIVMLHGSYAPFALRSSGDDYLLLGECYVDGWMSWQERGPELEETLRIETPKYFTVR